MSETGPTHAEPSRVGVALPGPPSRAVILATVDGEVVGEVVIESPTRAEARDLCRAILDRAADMRDDAELVGLDITALRERPKRS